jgi:hypothetical protein
MEYRNHLRSFTGVTRIQGASVWLPQGSTIDFMAMSTSGAKRTSDIARRAMLRKGAMGGIDAMARQSADCGSAECLREEADVSLIVETSECVVERRCFARAEPTGAAIRELQRAVDVVKRIDWTAFGI